ncbi:unnamed protein product [Schistocephalus solidus]|uniref:ubiquitinyl hydrolase 1 n=1 Tax=Schistocephalus solidus TaxID=70667 RepID=A0A183TR13_SCHSO|nr:unnamed protein product [Schistocephalus solidus]
MLFASRESVLVSESIITSDMVLLATSLSGHLVSSPTLLQTCLFISVRFWDNFLYIFVVNVKWKKQKFTDVECDTNEPPGSFKAVLFSLTGVPPERQNVMMPGGILGDANYDGIKLRDAPIEPAEIHERKLRMPIGIVNLGNTCYMNGTLQLLFLLPELRDALSVVEPSRLPPSMNENSKALVTSMRFLFQSMEKAEKAVIPVFFLKALHSNFPQFATTASNAAVGQLDPTLSAAGLGMPVYQQQDANECWTEVVRILQKVTVDSSALQNKPVHRAFLIHVSFSPCYLGLLSFASHAVRFSMQVPAQIKFHLSFYYRVVIYSAT